MSIDLEGQLIRDIAAVRHVVDVELNWSPALTVRVRLDAMDWGARSIILGLIGVYARRRADVGGIDVRFTIPEPIDFTEARVDSRG